MCTVVLKLFVRNTHGPGDVGLWGYKTERLIVLNFVLHHPALLMTQYLPEHQGLYFGLNYFNSFKTYVFVFSYAFPYIFCLLSFTSCMGSCKRYNRKITERDLFCINMCLQVQIIFYSYFAADSRLQIRSQPPTNFSYEKPLRPSMRHWFYNTLITS